MPDPDSGSATAKTSTFYTDADGYLKTPEKLPLGRYRVVEIEAPKGSSTTNSIMSCSS